MKILFKTLLILFISIIILSGAIILGARAGYLDKPIKKLIVYYLSKEHIPAQLADFHINHKGITISRLSYPVDKHTKLEISDLLIKLERGTSLKKPIIIAAWQAEVFLVSEQNKNFIKSKISGQFYHKLLTKIIELDVSFTELVTDSVLAPGQGNCSYKSAAEKTKNVNCNLNFGSQTTLHLKSSITQRVTGQYQNIDADLRIDNMPLAILQFIEKFSDDNAAIKQVDEMIKSGFIKHGELKIALDKHFFENKNISPANINGSFTIADLSVKYSNELPIVEKAQGELNIHGKDISFKVEEAYSNNILLSNSVITLAKMDSENASLIIDTNAKSTANQLIGFAPQDSLQKLAKIGIDLKKITGSVDTKINIIIPFSEHKVNIYDITMQVNNGYLKIFNDNITVSEAKLIGKFDGEKLFIQGDMNINKFASKVNYQLNLADARQPEQLLKIKTEIKNQYENLNLVKIIAGKSIVNFEYRVKDNVATIKADSDLKDLNFQIEKLGIHKNYGQKAKFNIYSTISDKKNNPIFFSLTGEDNLKIIGDILLGDEQKKISVSAFSYKKTNVNSEITSNKNEFKVRVRGDCIDLSEANLMSFLEKGKEGESDVISNIKFNIKKIKLKNDIWLNDVALAMKCDRTRCFKGYLNSNVGSKFFKMLLKTFEDREEWTVTSNNAGAIFRAFDLYKNLRAGTMIVTLNTSRKEVEKGEIVPILDGRFIFRKFVVTDTPILTRMVSFVSLPGLFNTVTNNKNIAFYEMNGKFNYDKDTININKAHAEGPFFDFGINGSVDTAKHYIVLKGFVIPSIYGITTIIKKVPFLGKALLGGKTRGIFSAPFNINQKY